MEICLAGTGEAAFLGGTSSGATTFPGCSPLPEGLATGNIVRESATGGIGQDAVARGEYEVAAEG